MLKEISHAWHVEFLTRTRDPFQVRIIDVLYFKTMIRSINFALAPALSHWAQWPMEARVTQNSLTKMSKWKCYLVNSKRNSYFIYSSSQVNWTRTVLDVSELLLRLRKWFLLLKLYKSLTIKTFGLYERGLITMLLILVMKTWQRTAFARANVRTCSLCRYKVSLQGGKKWNSTHWTF